MFRNRGRGGGSSQRPNVGPRRSNIGNGNGNGNHRGAVGMASFRVRIPDNVLPGDEFQVYAGSQIVRVRCPMDSRPGQSLQITVPVNSNGNTPPPSENGSASARNSFNSSSETAPRTSYNGNGNSYNNNYGMENRTSNGAENSSSTSPGPQAPQEQFQGNRENGNPQQQRNSSSVRRITDSDPPAYMVSIPQGVVAGEQFPVTIRGQQLMVKCPSNASPGMSVRIVPPLPEDPLEPQEDFEPNYNYSNEDSAAERNSGMYPQPPDMERNTSHGDGQLEHQNPRQQPSERTQLFEVEVPPGVEPGAPFALLAGGVRVLVVCPNDAGPGRRIRFQLPLALTLQHQRIENSRQQPNEMQQIKLSYDKDGWTRTVRATDLKFQWIRMDGEGGVDTDVMGGQGGRRRFNMDKSAYVRRLEFKLGEDPRIRTGILSLAPATESVVDSKIKSADGRDLVTYGDLARAQMKSFDEKTEWFQETCAKLCVEWNEGHMRMNIRRQYLLGDSVDAVMSLSRKDLRKLWRFEFIGEMGIDAGGLAREWFELVCKEIFDPDTGLWTSSATNQMSMTINPASEYCCEDHLVYYRFLGRVMGKAMFDRQLIKGHMVKHLYKHILGWPIYFKDLESIDEEYYNNLKQLRIMHNNGDDISCLCLDFTVTSEIMGIKKTVELVRGGADIEVTNDNFPEYVEACLKYKLMGSVKPQLNELLLGFFDVIPEPLLTIFDYQELELIMCGLPHIDLDDWKAHTEYSGEYEELCIHHPTVEWFWETLEEFNDEMKARLLLFVTGTSGVPSRGFGVLQSNDGNIRNFTIHGVSAEIWFYPRAHTCFNRIDLPLYGSKVQLQERLKLAVTMSATGFDIE